MLKLCCIVGILACLVWQPASIGVLMLVAIGMIIGGACKGKVDDAKKEVEDWRDFREWRKSQRDKDK